MVREKSTAVARNPEPYDYISLIAIERKKNKTKLILYTS